jgi:hypothetical protein
MLRPFDLKKDARKGIFRFIIAHPPMIDTGIRL